MKIPAKTKAGLFGGTVFGLATLIGELISGIAVGQAVVVAVVIGLFTGMMVAGLSRL